MSGTGETKLIFPGLAGLYAAVGPIAYALVRVIIGIMFLMHVSGKFNVGAAAVAANVMAKNGLEPSLGFAYAAIFLETVGGACLIIGLFTRPFAAALAIEMAIALLFVHLPKGYAAGRWRIRIRSADRHCAVRNRYAWRRHILRRPHDRQRSVVI